jgi:hypothetical protein
MTLLNSIEIYAQSDVYYRVNSAFDTLCAR